MALQDRIAGLKVRGNLGSRNKAVNQRFLADLPENMLVQGVNSILSGKNSNNPQVNNFVRTMAQQGKTPQEIVKEFRRTQGESDSPFVLL